MIEGPTTSDDENGPVQPGVDDQDVTVRMDAVHPEHAAERIRLYRMRSVGRRLPRMRQSLEV